ncbi:transporter [Ktedonobacteria bacterium brp13]|nr:transporter [Ktedonobacteria bacterium brp13]
MTLLKQETNFLSSAVFPSSRTHPHRLRGLLYTVIGAMCWGLSGTAAQTLLQYDHISAQWLVMVRLLGAALILYCWLRPAFPRQHIRAFICFAIFGLAGVQFTFFAAIASSNAATATCLQYVSMPMIAIYDIIIMRAPMTHKKLLALTIAFIGTFLLILGGASGVFALQITIPGLLMGLLSAAAEAYYLIASKRFVADNGAWSTTTWGFLIGGGVLLFVAPPWNVHIPAQPLPFLFLIAFIIIFGTLIAFGLTFSGVAYITATETSIAMAVQPITTTLAGFLLLHVSLTIQQYIGAACILTAVILLSLERGKKTG